jgi:hypothetical protein
MPSKELPLPDEAIENLIREIRGARVILDTDLAFQLTADEAALRSQIATASSGVAFLRSQSATQFHPSTFDICHSNFRAHAFSTP